MAEGRLQRTRENYPEGVPAFGSSRYDRWAPPTSSSAPDLKDPDPYAITTGMVMARMCRCGIAVAQGEAHSCAYTEPGIPAIEELFSVAQTEQRRRRDATSVMVNNMVYGWHGKSS